MDRTPDIDKPACLCQLCRSFLFCWGMFLFVLQRMGMFFVRAGPGKETRTSVENSASNIQK